MSRRIDIALDRIKNKAEEYYAVKDRTLKQRVEAKFQWESFKIGFNNIIKPKIEAEPQKVASFIEYIIEMLAWVIEDENP